MDRCFINTAPDDVLRIIFDILLDFGSEFGRYESVEPGIALLPLTLSHVCQRWRDLLLSPDYPSTWAHIYSTSHRVINLYLERSGTAQLDLHLSTLSKDCMDAVVVPNSDRLRQLHVFFQSMPPGVHWRIPDLDFKAPHMKCLTIVSPYNRLGPLSCPILSNEKLPNLSKLTILSVFFPPDAGFTKLTHLCLSNCSGSTEDLLTLLQANPALEELILFAGNRWKSTPVPTESIAPRIPLLFLRWLCLHNDISILHYISLSPTCALRISTPTVDLPPLPFPVAKLHLKRFCFTALSPDASGFVQYTTGTAKLAEWLPRAVADVTVFGAVREMWVNHMLRVDWGRVLEHLPELRVLHVGFGALAMDVLSTLTPSPGPGVEVVCPALREVYVSHGQCWMLQDLVRRRHERGVALEKLNLFAERAMADAEYAELKRWVGEVVVGYRGSPEASFGMDIPERFTEFRHASWISHRVF